MTRESASNYTDESTPKSPFCCYSLKFSMAFQRDQFRTFFDLLKSTQGLHPEERALAENFILEERLAELREDSYDQHLGRPQDLGEWMFNHKKYISQRINLSQNQETPETFTAVNSSNWLPEIEPDQFVVRMENLLELSKIARQSIDIPDIRRLEDYFSQFLQNRTNSSFESVIEDFLHDCNQNRDLRPMFVGFYGDVEDLLTDDHWPDKLRDRFGLGHYNPAPGEPIPVVLFRYRISDVIDNWPGVHSVAAIPTVLDSSVSPFFCPTPQKDWIRGQTINLTPGTENDYTFNCEILHPYVEYKAPYVYRFGWITESPGKTCEEARRIHLKYLQDDFKYFGQL